MKCWGKLKDASKRTRFFKTRIKCVRGSGPLAGFGEGVQGRRVMERAREGKETEEEGKKGEGKGEGRGMVFRPGDSLSHWL